MDSEELLAQTISRRVDEILVIREPYEEKLEECQEYIKDLLEPDLRDRVEEIINEMELEKQGACAVVYREAFRDGLAYGSMMAARILKKLI